MAAGLGFNRVSGNLEIVAEGGILRYNAAATSVWESALKNTNQSYISVQLCCLQAGVPEDASITCLRTKLYINSLRHTYRKLADMATA